MHEDGIGMARAFEMEFLGATSDQAIGVQTGFFAWVDGAPRRGLPRAARGRDDGDAGVRRRAARRSAILTGTSAPQVLAPLVAGSVATTCGSCRWTTSSSAATSASPG